MSPFATLHWQLIALAAALVGVSAITLRKQLCGTSCPRHSRLAGRLALVLGSLGLVLAAALLILALRLRTSAASIFG